MHEEINMEIKLKINSWFIGLLQKLLAVLLRGFDNYSVKMKTVRLKKRTAMKTG